MAKKVFGIIGTVVFFITYLPFLLLIEYSLHGIQSGIIGGEYVYGFEAIGCALLFLSVVPVYPICVLYQLIFGIAYVRRHRKIRIAAIATVACIVTAVIGAAVYKTIIG